MAPRVSIGLPVYNGEQFVRQAIDSVLAQTYTDFELIISDNASTDKTPAICRLYAQKDSRISFHRNRRNIGPARNFNTLVRLCKGEYFQWLSHDDVLAPEFIAKSVHVLDQDSAVVLCFSREVAIDEANRELRPGLHILPMDADTPRTRFSAVLRNPIGSPIVFGLMRSDILRKTRLIGNYDAADLILTLELALRGKLHQIQENLLFHREHPHRSVYDYPTLHAHTVWFAPWKEGKILFPAWRIFGEGIRGVWRSPIGLMETASCLLCLDVWAMSNVRRGLTDFNIAARQIAGRLKWHLKKALSQRSQNESKT